MARHRHALVVLAVSALAAGGCSSSDSTAQSASPHCDDDGPVVALNRNSREGGEGLADVIVADRNGGVDLVTGDWVATKPSFSPDGRSLAVVRADGDYESAGPGSTTLWVIGTDGSAPRALTEGLADDEPAWSPDGDMIAFSQGIEEAEGIRRQLAIVPSEGGNARPLVETESSEDDALAPAWSPDGRELAFIRGDTADTRTSTIWLVDADGSHPREVAEVADAHSVEWHPDGESLLVSTFGQEDGAVWLVDLDEGTETQIADHATFAVWSPDGETIYHFSKEGAPQPSWWRLAEGRLDGERLEHDRDVGRIEDYLYHYFGLAVSPCA